MDIKGLEYVAAVAKTGSFTKAAEVLFVAQPALSRKIAQVEKEFGVTLFERERQGVRLTTAGEIFYGRAHQILRDCEGLTTDMENLRRGKLPLRLIYFTSGAVPYVARTVHALEEKSPEVEVLFQPPMSAIAAIDEVRQGHIDVMITFRPSIANVSEGWMRYKPIEQGGLCAFVGEGHPLYGQEAVDTERLRENVLVLPADRKSPVLDIALRRALGNPEHVVYSRDSNDFRVQILSRGHVGIMPYSSRTLASDFLHCMLVSDVTDGFDLVAAWSCENQSVALKKYLSII